MWWSNLYDLFISKVQSIWVLKYNDGWQIGRVRLRFHFIFGRFFVDLFYFESKRLFERYREGFILILESNVYFDGRLFWVKIKILFAVDALVFCVSGMLSLEGSYFTINNYPLSIWHCYCKVLRSRCISIMHTNEISYVLCLYAILFRIIISTYL